MDVRKTLVIAIREYLAAVKTKSFIISLILLPVMMSGGIIAQKLGQKIGDTTTKRVAVIDRTPEAVLYRAVEQAVQKRNANDIFDETKRQVHPKFELEKVAPADLNDRAAVDRQRLELSQRVRSGELLAFVEIGPDALKPATMSVGDEPDDRMSIRYSTNRPTFRDFVAMLQPAIQPVVFEKRLADAGISYQALRPSLRPPEIIDRGLASEVEGKVSYEPRTSQLASFIVPLALLMLMFVVTIVGASPMTANVIEE